MVVLAVAATARAVTSRPHPTPESLSGTGSQGNRAGQRTKLGNFRIMQVFGRRQ
jgi:hypothetical protein